MITVLPQVKCKGRMYTYDQKLAQLREVIGDWVNFFEMSGNQVEMMDSMLEDNKPEIVEMIVEEVLEDNGGD